jgi:CheY-like chemotaxis protein
MPVLAIDPTHGGKPRRKSASPGIEDPRAGTVEKRVLVVDDQEDVALAIADELEMLGCEVALAHDGVSALEMIGTFRPDFVLVDIAMAGINGWEVARRARRLVCDEPPRLVAISAFGQDVHKARSAAAGFEAHLTKPLKLQQLAALLASERPRGSH